MFAGSRKEKADHGACLDAQAFGLLHRLGSTVIMSHAKIVEGVYSHGGDVMGGARPLSSPTPPDPAASYFASCGNCPGRRFALLPSLGRFRRKAMTPVHKGDANGHKVRIEGRKSAIR